MRLFLCASLGGALSVLSSCNVCSLAYFPDYLEVTFSTPQSAAGIWEIELTGDVEATCELVLPLPIDASIECGSAPILLSVSDDRSTLRGFTIWAEPASVQVRLFHEGTERGAAVLTPRYARDEPNGRRCGERRHAMEALDVPTP